MTAEIMTFNPLEEPMDNFYGVLRRNVPCLFDLPLLEGVFYPENRTQEYVFYKPGSLSNVEEILDFAFPIFQQGLVKYLQEKPPLACLVPSPTFQMGHQYTQLEIYKERCYLGYLPGPGGHMTVLFRVMFLLG